MKDPQERAIGRLIREIFQVTEWLLVAVAVLFAGNKIGSAPLALFGLALSILPGAYVGMKVGRVINDRLPDSKFGFWGPTLILIGASLLIAALAGKLAALLIASSS